MIKINIEIKKIENGFVVINSYLDDEEKYFKTFQEVKDYTDVCLNHFQEEELK